MIRAILVVATMLTAVLLGSAVTAYAQAPVPKDGPITIENHTWEGGYHWARTVNPFTLQLGDNVDKTWDEYLKTTTSLEQNVGWDYSTVLDTDIVPGGVTGVKGDTVKKCAPTLGRVEVCNSRYGRTDWLGIAGITVTVSNDPARNGHIIQGYTKLNDTYFRTTRYNTPAWRNLVMCQEVGHTFGLDHQDENFNNANLGSCQDYTNAPDTNQYPNQADYDQLLCIYDPDTYGITLSTPPHSCTGTGHLDSYSTVGPFPSSPSTPSRKPPTDDLGNDPSQWGREVYRSPDGRVSLYELDLDNENKTLTRVRWTEEEAKRRAQENTSQENTSQEKAKPEETSTTDK